MSFQLVLATDLDGTFLEADSRTKQFFYNKLVHLREQVGLIYTTGRSVDVVRRFCMNGYLPFPHFVIADHGTHIVDGANFSPLTDLQNPIIEKWKNGNHLLRELLKNETGIQLQPIDPPYRVAYYYDSNSFQTETLKKITGAGFDWILSCDQYLDIVPEGVNKGTTLLKLLDHLKIDYGKVVTAGDSLNDLSLFQTGLKGIAVSNSEHKLIDAIKTLDNVYLSQFPGVLGIIQGLQFYHQFSFFQEMQNR